MFNRRSFFKGFAAVAAGLALPGFTRDERGWFATKLAPYGEPGPMLHYTKTGKMVHMTGYLTTSSNKGTRIVGLPYVR